MPEDKKREMVTAMLRLIVVQHAKALNDKDAAPFPTDAEVGEIVEDIFNIGFDAGYDVGSDDSLANVMEVGL